MKSIANESLGNNLGNAKGFCSILRLLWCQTKPIFIQPHLKNTWKLSFIIFVIFSIAHGTFQWFPDFLLKLQKHFGTPKTLCEIVGHKLTAETFIEEYE